MCFSLTPLLLGALAAGCSSSTPKAPEQAAGATADGPCDPEFRSVLAKQTDMDAETLARLTLTGIGESCSGLPGDIQKTLEAVTQVDPADGATLMMAGLDEESSFARLGCPGFEAAKSAMLAAPGPERARAFFKSCELGRLNLVSEAEVDRAWKTGAFASGVLAAPSLYVWLVEHRMTKAEARKLTRQVMGLH
jgi:hypothetical protein